LKPYGLVSLGHWIDLFSFYRISKMKWTIVDDDAIDAALKKMINNKAGNVKFNTMKPT